MAMTHATGTGADSVRSRAQLLAENALLRQQLLVLRRSVARPALTRADRTLLVLLAGRVRAWRQALLLVQPETLLRWHRAGFRALWQRKSRPGPGRPPLTAETVALIRRMAADNPLWGAERIRGELLKLGIRVAKRTIQTYLRSNQAPRPRGRAWATFLRAHAAGIWACDFLPVTDLLFRPLYAFFVIARGSRRVVHVGVTRHPTDAWVAQQLREATGFGRRPRHRSRDNDRQYGPAFARVAAAAGIAVLRTAYRAQRANAVCERFLGSVRRECLDHLLVLSEAHVRRTLREYVAYCNTARPHQGLRQRVPAAPAGCAPRAPPAGTVRAVPILGGLHHAYERAA
jgi:putative transposase